MISKLPENLLIKIIDYTGSCKSIGQCRTVCKQWNRLAEPLMFSKQIVVKNGVGAISLYGHLCRKPENGQYIKNLRFECTYIPTFVLLGIVRLAFTPSMEYMTGSVGHPELYTILNRLAGKEPEKFTRLKALPNPGSYCALYSQTLQNFKETLQDIVFVFDSLNEDEDYWHVVEQLEEFRNLKKLRLDVDSVSLFSIENVLKGCCALEEVGINMQLQDDLYPKSEMEAWNTTNVQIVETVRKLSIINGCRPDLLEYLIFKYPNVDTIDIDVKEAVDVTKHSLQRLLNVITKVHTYTVSFKVKDADLVASLQYLIAGGCRFNIQNIFDSGYRILINSQSSA